MLRRVGLQKTDRMFPPRQRQVAEILHHIATCRHPHEGNSKLSRIRHMPRIRGAPAATNRGSVSSLSALTDHLASRRTNQFLVYHSRGSLKTASDRSASAAS